MQQLRICAEIKFEDISSLGFWKTLTFSLPYLLKKLPSFGLVVLQSLARRLMARNSSGFPLNATDFAGARSRVRGWMHVDIASRERRVSY